MADDGTLVYRQGGRPGPRLAWVDREGREEPLPLEGWEPRVSPDGRSVAVTMYGSNSDVWISELASETSGSRITNDPRIDHRPLWTPTGERVVFQSGRDGSPAVYQRNADGTGPVDKLLRWEGPGQPGPRAWSPDGRLLFTYGASGAEDIGLLTIEGDERWEPLLQTESGESAPTISPDGDWIAYVSDETGQSEIYVQRFPNLGEKRPISTAGGDQPLWSHDGRELFYVEGGKRMMSVSIDRGPPFTSGRPDVLFDGPYMFGDPTAGSSRLYDVHPDGRFLMVQNLAEDARTQVTVVLNWFEELKERVPIP